MNTQHKLLSSCPVSCFADEIAESLDRQIEVLSRLGISYVELRSADGINAVSYTHLDVYKRQAKNSSPKIFEISPRLISSMMNMYFFSSSCFAFAFETVPFFALIAL